MMIIGKEYKGTTDKGMTDEGTTDKGMTDEGTTDEGTTDKVKQNKFSDFFCLFAKLFYSSFFFYSGVCFFSGSYFYFHHRVSLIFYLYLYQYYCKMKKMDHLFQLLTLV